MQGRGVTLLLLAEQSWKASPPIQGLVQWGLTPSQLALGEAVIQWGLFPYAGLKIVTVKTRKRINFSCCVQGTRGLVVSLLHLSFCSFRWVEKLGVELRGGKGSMHVKGCLISALLSASVCAGAQGSACISLQPSPFIMLWSSSLCWQTSAWPPSWIQAYFLEVRTVFLPNKRFAWQKSF